MKKIWAFALFLIVLFACAPQRGQEIDPSWSGYTVPGSSRRNGSVRPNGWNRGAVTRLWSAPGQKSMRMPGISSFMTRNQANARFWSLPPGSSPEVNPSLSPSLITNGPQTAKSSSSSPTPSVSGGRTPGVTIGSWI